MSTAFYIVLDNEAPGFDPFVNGKALAAEAARLDAVCRKLGLRRFDEFLSVSGQDISDLLGEEIELPDEEEKWFAPDEGIAFVAALTEHLKAHPEDVRNPEDVLSDLAEYADVLYKAKKIGAKWRVALDI